VEKYEKKYFTSSSVEQFNNTVHISLLYIIKVNVTSELFSFYEFSYLFYFKNFHNYFYAVLYVGSSCVILFNHVICTVLQYGKIYVFDLIYVNVTSELFLFYEFS
jgi:hypothetical protein